MVELHLGRYQIELGLRALDRNAGLQPPDYRERISPSIGLRRTGTAPAIVLEPARTP
jgi:hypothetical protein